MLQLGIKSPRILRQHIRLHWNRPVFYGSTSSCTGIAPCFTATHPVVLESPRILRQHIELHWKTPRKTRGVFQFLLLILNNMPTCLKIKFLHFQSTLWRLILCLAPKTKYILGSMRSKKYIFRTNCYMKRSRNVWIIKGNYL